MSRIPNGILPLFEKETGIAVSHISAYLSGDRPMSKKRSLVLGVASKSLGYDFAAADWMFNPKKIKQALINQTPPEAA